LEKSSPKLWAISAIFQKLPKANNRPLGENSPNLVTLAPGSVILTRFFELENDQKNFFPKLFVEEILLKEVFAGNILSDFFLSTQS
jgi:hypothetical protein